MAYTVADRSGNAFQFEESQLPTPPASQSKLLTRKRKDMDAVKIMDVGRHYCFIGKVDALLEEVDLVLQLPSLDDPQDR
jgi:hypothetical protein